MSRGFFGSSGLGGGRNPFGPKKRDTSYLFSRKRKRSMQEMIENKNSHKIKGHKEMLEDLIDDRMFSLDKKSMGFHLPGTQGNEDNKKYSKGYMQALEHAKQKRMKQRVKQRDKAVKVVAKPLQNGRIDSKGRILNNKGQVVMQINLETGIIKDAMGMKICKYKPFSHNMDGKLERLIDKYTNRTVGWKTFSGEKQ